MYTYGQETPEVPQMLVLLLSLGSFPPAVYWCIIKMGRVQLPSGCAGAS